MACPVGSRADKDKFTPPGLIRIANRPGARLATSHAFALFGAEFVSANQNGM